MRDYLLPFLLLLVGCDVPDVSAPSGPWDTSAQANKETLLEARAGFKTKLISRGSPAGPPDTPPEDVFELIRYESPVGKLAAYVTPDPGNGEKRPAIIWITGGDNNSIGNVWSPYPRVNDQSARQFREAGMVMMFPSQRGGNDNPGRREGFLGEVDDILAATDYLAGLPYVDSEQIYLGGHSTGGTMAMMVGAASDRYRAIFALGPVDDASGYGGDYIYCDPYDDKEVLLRSPLYWLHCVQSPMYVFEGGQGSNNWASVDAMADESNNPKIKFFKVPGHDHFTLIAPLCERLAQQIVQGELDITQQTVKGLR